ncbi:uncharacterized protein MONOS_12254 [Monocercomonoides exilis]|uniref:uncharacterized protein n=1 Tax=Monocercomonoides exilis TaxID=2049356 RepID=UPI003559622D|nr:hypothetical protein MONOS_12254 [Monocercomonoides exilis]|eukprot:MONOS_12254.1-p1 / transcript=MONOS_12254.1 / gene=MONOS_12254 / organism=Monocercomonoides_exilis_PA203 / gene_product=unspecified product / transcript_product=unspecified product / location=Mono_scaffold00665:27457-28316(+) / protein_length=177 / sequence_SO=supercontig / SO=protein_coding / is_pseudo=false
MEVPFSLRCAFSVEQLMVCGFDDIRRLRGLNAMTHMANQNLNKGYLLNDAVAKQLIRFMGFRRYPLVSSSLRVTNKFITNGAEFHSVFLRNGILQPIHRLLHSPRAEYSDKASSILLSLTSKSFKLFTSSLDKALFNELVELMYSPQAIVRNNASEIIEALAEGRGLDEEGDGEGK